MTRARAKLLGQQVNSLLNEYDICDNENFILPKSMHLCMIRVVGNTSIGGGPEEKLESEHNVTYGAREEWEECAKKKEEESSAGLQAGPPPDAAGPQAGLGRLPGRAPPDAVGPLQTLPGPLQTLPASRTAPRPVTLVLDRNQFWSVCIHFWVEPNPV